MRKGMDMTLSAQETFFVVCSECKCSKEIHDKEVPEGDCEYCRKNFGFHFFPGQTINGDKTLNNDHVLIDHLEPGDIVTVNTKLHPEDPNRIYSIQRDGRYIFLQKK